MYHFLDGVSFLNPFGRFFFVLVLAMLPFQGVACSGHWHWWLGSVDRGLPCVQRADRALSWDLAGGQCEVGGLWGWHHAGHRSLPLLQCPRWDSKIMGFSNFSRKWGYIHHWVYNHNFNQFYIPHTSRCLIFGKISPERKTAIRSWEDDRKVPSGSKLICRFREVFFWHVVERKEYLTCFCFKFKIWKRWRRGFSWFFLSLHKIN